jgi:hypothetical protein
MPADHSFQKQALIENHSYKNAVLREIVFILPWNYKS